MAGGGAGMGLMQQEGLLLTNKDLATSNSRGQHGGPDLAPFSGAWGVTFFFGGGGVTF